MEQQEPRAEEEEQQGPPPYRKKKLDPTENIIKISQQRRISFYVFLSKIFFKKFEEIELHALGEAIQTCARVAQDLKRFELGVITKIETSTEYT